MPEAPSGAPPPQPPRPRWRSTRPPAPRNPDQRDPDQRNSEPQRNPGERNPEQPAKNRRTEPRRDHPEPTEAAITLARFEQRLAQERLVMQARLDKELALRRIQVAMGWLLVVMLPSVAIVCVGVMLNYARVPRSMLTSAAGAFFVDIVGLVVAGWKTLLIRNLGDEPLIPVTQLPELHQTIDVDAAEPRVTGDPGPH